MAVTQQSDGNSKKSVKERAETSCREGSSITKDASGMVKGYKPKQNQIIGNKSKRRSAIDDAEVSGYLNTKEEIHLKRILWEARNEKFIKAKKQKQTTEKKKGVSARKAAKTTKKSEVEMRSSKINYDALKMLDDELGQTSETAEAIGSDFSAHRTEYSTHGNIGQRTQGSNKSSYEDDQQDTSYYEDDDTFGEGETYNGCGDEQFSAEYLEF